MPLDTKFPSLDDERAYWRRQYLQARAKLAALNNAIEPQLLALAKQGLSGAEISRRLQMSLPLVLKIIKANGNQEKSAA